VHQDNDNKHYERSGNEFSYNGIKQPFFYFFFHWYYLIFPCAIFDLPRRCNNKLAPQGISVMWQLPDSTQLSDLMWRPGAEWARVARPSDARHASAATNRPG
jgi:hypothetical protein